MGELCQKEDLKLFGVVLGIVITTFLVISYIPQQVKILKTKNSYGISPYSQFLSIFSQTLTLFNIYLLQKTMLNCCISGKFPFWHCMGSLVGLIQVLLQWICIAIIFVLFVKFYPVNLNPILTSPIDGGHEVFREWKTIVRIVYLYVALVVIMIGISILAIYGNWSNESIVVLAGVFGLSSSALAFVQFIPQIIKTFLIKSVGALSIPTMSVQCPGSYILVLFLAFQPGTNWTTWFTYFVSGTFQGILLCLCIYYKYSKNEDDSIINPNENTDIESY